MILIFAKVKSFSKNLRGVSKLFSGEGKIR